MNLKNAVKLCRARSPHLEVIRLTRIPPEQVKFSKFVRFIKFQTIFSSAHFIQEVKY